MTSAEETVKPSTSPPAKRIKTSPASLLPTSDVDSTMADSNGTAPVTKLDQAPPLLIKKLSDKARLPTRGSAFAAGYDLYAAQATTVPARGKVLVDTGLSMAVPAGTCKRSCRRARSISMLTLPPADGRIAPRSGLAAKHFIDTGAGVIDADYRGPVKVLLFNHGDVDFPVAEGDRVAQLVLERIYTPEVLEVQELEESARGAGGFGSTGGFAGTTPA